jgi:hypothetical protein
VPENVPIAKNLKGLGHVPFSPARLEAELNYYLIPEEARKETAQLKIQRARHVHRRCLSNSSTTRVSVLV